MSRLGDIFQAKKSLDFHLTARLLLTTECLASIVPISLDAQP
jgi:hypothetical protein